MADAILPDQPRAPKVVKRPLDPAEARRRFFEIVFGLRPHQPDPSAARPARRLKQDEEGGAR